ncbi:hypothetical protein Tco_0600758 [Tanacetum coccineum]
MYNDIISTPSLNISSTTIPSRQGSQSLDVFRDMQMESSETRDYPSLIQTFFNTHTDGGEFAQDEARVQYVRGDDSAENTSTVVPYTEDQIMAMVRKGNGSGRGGDDEPGGDDELGGDEDADEDEENNASFVARQPDFVDFIMYDVECTMLFLLETRICPWESSMSCDVQGQNDILMVSEHEEQLVSWIDVNYAS